MTGTAGRFWHATAGVAARRALAEYLKMVALIMLILLCVAWTIDLAKSFPDIRALAGAEDRPTVLVLGHYLGLRAVDIVNRLLPMACFFGVFLAEIQRRLRLESVVLNAAGLSTVRRIAPAALAGLLLGGLITALESPIRPQAIFAQVDLGLGSYAERYRRGRTDGAAWYLDDNLAVRGHIRRTSDPAFEDALIFAGFRGAELETVYAVQEAVPTAERFRWELRGVTRWLASEGRAGAEAIERMTLEMQVLPEQLEYHDVGLFAVPTPALQTMASLEGTSASVPVTVTLWKRWTVGLVPLAFTLLAVALVPYGFAGRVPHVPRLIALALVGYGSVVSVRVMWALGELGSVPPLVAVFGATGFALALSAVLFFRQS